MSSHHIVRDEQEPALILHQLGSFSTDVLHSLLEWSPTVVGCEPAINRFTSLGHKLDVVLVGFQNFNFWQEQLSDQQPVKIIASQGGGFLMTGLTILQREGHKAVNVVTDDASYHDVVELVSEWIHILDIVIYTPSKRVLIVRDMTFRKWLPVGSVLRLVCLEGDCEWQTDDVIGTATKNADELEVKVEKEGDIIIQSNKPPFLVIEKL